MTAAANEIVNAVESQGDKFKANTTITTTLLGDLEQLSTCVDAVTVISRDNATATSDLVKLLRQSPGASPASSNGDLKQLASQLKATVGA
jgi:hypothetical protein